MLSKKFEVPLSSDNEKNPVYQEEIQIGSEVEILKRSSQQYKVQNEYLNDANDNLMQANQIFGGSKWSLSRIDHTCKGGYKEEEKCTESD